MLKSLQVSEAGMQVQQTKLEILANNLANASTPGFRRILSALENTEGVEPALPAEGALPLQGEGAPSLRLLTTLDLRPGSMQSTGNPLDVAVQGDGFFVLRTPDGMRYTRNGSFSTDAEGRLVGPLGHAVQGEGGGIQLPAGPVEITSDGAVRVSGQEVDRLRIVRFDRHEGLTPEGEGLLRAEEPSIASSLEAAEVRLAPGYLEGSNTNPISELVALIMAQRVFEAGQRVLTTTDGTLGRTVNDVGRVR